MSIERRHAMFAGRVLPPIIIQTTVNVFPGTVTFYTITPGVAVTPGNLMVAIMGGIQSRTLIPPAGWSHFLNSSAGGGTMDFLYKLAAVGEPSSYTFTYTGGNIQGAWAFFEVQNADVGSLVTQFIPDDAVNKTSLAFTPYNIAIPAIVFAAWGTKTLGTPSIDNSFIPIITANGVAARFNAAYRIYSQPLNGEVTTWSQLESQRIFTGISSLRGKTG